MRTLEEEITLRTEQRKRYFENPDYRKWSDCVNINHEEYGELSDCYLFHRYVMGSYFGPLTIDDFERAIADKTEDATAIKEGFDLIFKKFLKTLEGIGVNKIETEDKDFNVDYHEAIAMVPGMGDDKKGKIIDCVQTGYMLNDKVIRHAKVAVGQ